MADDSISQTQTDDFRFRRRRSRRLIEWLSRIQPPELAFLFATAVFVGTCAGFGALLFRWMILIVREMSFGGLSHTLGFLAEYYIILVPALGGLIVGPIIARFTREAKGHGVPEVMEAVAIKGGRIRPVTVVVKTIASSLSIGTGGSAGQEGPIVQIGASLGSVVGQSFRMSDDRIRMLVACGAAGGIAATFNAPIAGVIFALEVVLGEFAASHFSTVVIASVTASVISRVFLGNYPAFAVPAYTLRSAMELPLYVVLGIAAAPLGVGFSRLLYATEDLFDRLRVSPFLKPAVGGLGVGMIGLWYPQIFGVGYEAIEDVLHNRFVLSTVLALVFLKMIATCLTLGSGGSGGVFAPALFMGAMLGGTFGGVVNRFFPAFTAQAGAYGLVGMAAVFAAASRAPISAVLILFEMTGEYRIILPLMLSTVVATMLATYLEPESIYTMKLARRGIRLEEGRDIDVMQSVEVSEVMTTDKNHVPPEMKLDALLEFFQVNHRHAIPVVRSDGTLLGMVSLSDIEEVVGRSDSEGLAAGDIATRTLETVFSDEAVWVALKRMGARDLSSLPVVDRNDSRRLVGVIRRRDIVRAYNLAIFRKSEALQRTEEFRMRSGLGSQLREVVIERGAKADGSTLKSLSLPAGCLVASVKRGGRTIVPGGDTMLRAGDRLAIVVDGPHLESVASVFEAGETPGKKQPVQDP